MNRSSVPAVFGFPRRPPRRRGLTLLEVLLSLVILLIAIVAVASLVDIGIDLSTRGQLQAAGTRLAQSKLAEVEAGAVDVTTSANGTFEEEPEWSWTMTSTPSTAPNVYTVTVRVSKEHLGREFDVELTQLVYDPYLMGTATEATMPETNSAGSPTTTTTATTMGGTTP